MQHNVYALCARSCMQRTKVNCAYQAQHAPPIRRGLMRTQIRKYYLVRQHIADAKRMGVQVQLGTKTTFEACVYKLVRNKIISKMPIHKIYAPV